MTNYRKTIEYLYKNLPIFQKIGHLAYKKDLSSTTKLMNLHGNPEEEFKSVLIAGTNGKGSVSTMLAEIFRKNGFKVGLYTSPHFKDFRERIRINGKKISKKFVIKFVTDNKEAWSEIKPSFFEITVAMAFTYFAEEKVDIAIVEVGMGGRLDSTNVLKPELSIITRIGLDHQKYLGDTIEEIAQEKAGIIKSKGEVVIGKNKQEAILAIHEIAKKANADVHQAKAFAGELPETIPQYQRENIGTVLKACERLEFLGWELKKVNKKKRCFKTLIKGKLPGRWQLISENPKIIAEAAHNIDGLKVCLQQLQKEKYDALHIVFGTVNDKEVSPILQLLPKNASYYFCKANIPRGKDADALAEQANNIGLQGNAYKSVAVAYNQAKSRAQVNDFILVTGSIFVISEII